MVSERVEKSSPAGLAGIKHSTEGRGELLDTPAGPKNQVTFGRHVRTLFLPGYSSSICICVGLMC